MRNVLDKTAEKMKIHFSCSLLFFPPPQKIVPFMEKSGRAKQARADNIIRRMRFACRINKARIQSHKKIP
jgi:hypothetical protein